jgi:hypothetical protein
MFFSLHCAERNKEIFTCGKDRTAMSAEVMNPGLESQGLQQG